MTKTHQTLLILAAVVTLGGCATPQPVLDEAKLTTTMMVELDTQLATFKSEMDKVDGQRNQVLAEQRRRIEEREATLGAFSLDTVAPVNKPEAETYFRLRKAAEVKGAALEEANAPIVPTILERLPDVHTPLKAAQTAMGPLASELDASERFKTTQQFIKDIRDGVELNEKKIADAKKAAAPGPAPSGTASK